MFVFGLSRSLLFAVLSRFATGLASGVITITNTALAEARVACIHLSQYADVYCSCATTPTRPRA